MEKMEGEIKKGTEALPERKRWKEKGLRELGVSAGSTLNGDLPRPGWFERPATRKSR